MNVCVHTILQVYSCLFTTIRYCVLYGCTVVERYRRCNTRLQVLLTQMEFPENIRSFSDQYVSTNSQQNKTHTKKSTGMHGGDQWITRVVLLVLNRAAFGPHRLTSLQTAAQTTHNASSVVAIAYYYCIHISDAKATQSTQQAAGYSHAIDTGILRFFLACVDILAIGCCAGGQRKAYVKSHLPLGKPRRPLPVTKQLGGQWSGSYDVDLYLRLR